MINPHNSHLYKLSSKKDLMYLLKIKDKRYLKQKYVLTHLTAYISQEKKPRLIEPPAESLKIIQHNIKKELGLIEVPYNVFSGIKGRSYIDNARLHMNNDYLFKIDLTAFFPCITRQYVYKFFKEELHTSSDVANILTNLVTIDLDKCTLKDTENIYQFLDKKGIKTNNHLISGSPTSQILSYLVNHKMFDQLQLFCDKNDITMSIYVDDITFSAKHKISYKQKQMIYKIISKHLYRLSRNKVKYYDKGYPKLVTGSVISSDGTLKIPNSLKLKIFQQINVYQSNPDDTNKNRLRGLLIAARQSEPTKFQNYYNLVINSASKQ